MRFLTLRAVVLLGFVVAMPVLALPPVARKIDEWLYGPPPDDFAQAPAAEAGSPNELLVSAPLAPAESAEPLWPREATAPPPLAPVPSFAPLAAPAAPNAPPPPAEPAIDDATIARLQQIRQALEQLGAEYVIAETIDGSGQYRFHCRMLVDLQSRFTRAFEATSANPLSAAEQVLDEVQAWRQAGQSRQASLPAAMPGPVQPQVR
jgi:3-oxoacyl-ACP reductase-like protein